MKKLNDYLKDDYGLKKIELSKIKKVENNKQKRFKKSIILIILISILIAIYISINKGDDLTIPSAQEIKNESKPSSTTIDTLKIDSQIVEKNNLPIEIKKSEVLINDKKTGKYYIISGSFKDYELSLNEANEFLNNGFQSSIILPIENKNGYYRVAIDAHLNKEEAIIALNNYKNTLKKELWILKH
tara:strand:+ start:2221 stop:2778 length:558 start_codon:yes stop_codon:yes gene_type:complete